MLVHVERDLVEPGDERVLDPVHEDLRQEHEQAVCQQNKNVYTSYSNS